MMLLIISNSILKIVDLSQDKKILTNTISIMLVNINVIISVSLCGLWYIFTFDIAYEIYNIRDLCEKEQLHWKTDVMFW